MKKEITLRAGGLSARLKQFGSFVLVGSLLAGAANAQMIEQLSHKQNKGFNYIQTNLVSDQPGMAIVQDTNLVNAWGISFGPATPFWVSANGTGRSTIYAVTNDASGMPHVTKQQLEVTIPGEENVTGQVFNDTTNFHGDIFLFVSEDGVISGWPGQPATAAEILASRPTANYKGVTLATFEGEPVLLAANFAEGSVDVYDKDVNLVGQLKDPRAPQGYAPFNVQNFDGMIFVTFAKQDVDKEDDVAGDGHGLIEVLNLKKGKFRRFAAGSDAGGRLAGLNSPWGLAIAPKGFADRSERLLVGNFGSGTIMVFTEGGRFEGFLESSPGNPIVIDGLWALAFGSDMRAGDSGTLYFTAGPDDETHGLFGSLQSVARQGTGQGGNGHGGGSGHGNY